MGTQIHFHGRLGLKAPWHLTEDFDKVTWQNINLPTVGFIEAIIGFLNKQGWRAIVALGIAAFVLLRFAVRLGTYDTSRPLHTWLLGVLIFCVAFSLTYPLSGMYPWLSDQWRDLRMMRLGKQHLHLLSNDEKEFCRWFLENGGDSLHHNQANGALGSLLEKNILFTPGLPWGKGIRDFRIRPWALKYLKEHPDLCIKKEGAA
jgi:hypothetical protein